MRRAALILLLPLVVGFDLLQSPNKAVEQGNAQLKGGKAEDALGHYDQAVKTLPADPGVHFDRGAALFALSRYDESKEEFLRATEAKTAPLKAAAFYNLGNAFFKTEKFDDAIAAYRRSLVFDPHDVRAKWNLELALKKKKDQDNKDKQDNKNKQDNKDKQDKDKKDEGKEDQKKEQSQKDQKDQQDKKDQKDQDKPDGQDKNEQQAKQEKQDKKDQPKEGPAKPPPPDKAADMKEIEAVLDSLERSPKDLEQERARRRLVRRAPPVKDW